MGTICTWYRTKCLWTLHKYQKGKHLKKFWVFSPHLMSHLETISWGGLPGGSESLGWASSFQSFHPFTVHFLLVVWDGSPQLFLPPWLPVAILPCHGGDWLLGPWIHKPQINPSLLCIALVMVFYLSNRKATKKTCMNSSLWNSTPCTMSICQ